MPLELRFPGELAVVFNETALQPNPSLGPVLLPSLSYHPSLAHDYSQMCFLRADGWTTHPLTVTLLCVTVVSFLAIIIRVL